MKDKAYNITNTTRADYENWCIKNNKPKYKLSSKTEFFNLVLHDKLVKDRLTGKLVRKRPRRK